ncbi:MAG TPA: MarR family transcriptional regulator, partial [Deltaproteobacteria bacterium]|nr:MarR family transcriptional regulator [Deltaproteobacteria bacterium]
PLTHKTYIIILVVMTTLNDKYNQPVGSLNVPFDKRLGFLIYRAHTRGVVAFKRTLQAKGYDITPEQLSVLAWLRQQEGMNQSQLGEKVFKDRHNMTRILGLLEKKGLIDRRPDETDSRAYRLYLSDAGRDILKNLRPIYINHWREQVEGLNKEDIETLRRILGHISDNLENMISRL